MKKQAVLLTLLVFMTSFSSAQAMEEVRVTASVISASNQGSDINLVNDEYRDELIKLFSYSSYNQLNAFAASLKKAERQHFELSGGYELILTLQGLEKDRVLVQAIIRKENRQYVDTVLSILRPGVVFLGGPALPEGGELIIVLETGF